MQFSLNKINTKNKTRNILHVFYTVARTTQLYCTWPKLDKQLRTYVKDTCWRLPTGIRKEKRSWQCTTESLQVKHQKKQKWLTGQWSLQVVIIEKIHLKHGLKTSANSKQIETPRHNKIVLKKILWWWRPPYILI